MKVATPVASVVALAGKIESVTPPLDDVRATALPLTKFEFASLSVTAMVDELPTITEVGDAVMLEKVDETGPGTKASVPV